MTYEEVLAAARNCSGPYCKACPVCNGRACGNTIPGPGAKGLGGVAARNYQKWQEICLNMDTIGESGGADTTLSLFGRTFALPVFAGPVGAMQLHYGDKYDDLTYNSLLVSDCRDSGILAFTGDGTNPAVLAGAAEAIRLAGGAGIPTVKPWDQDTVMAKLALAGSADPVAVAMDIAAAGLPFLRGRTPPAGSKTVDELREIAACAGRPFILKGIMTPRGAEKAAKAGAAAIVGSNHGGRVLDQCPATAEVLPEIAAAVGKDLTILVDGGIRSGADIFKALALGADGVLIARPFVTAVYGGGSQGVALYVQKLRDELADVMAMCGVHRLAEIDSACVRRP